MRYLFGFLCVCALGVIPLVGCSDDATSDGGSGGSAGSGGMPECQSPEDCDDREECTTDDCTEGACEYTSVADGTACDESNECAVGQCASGACGLTPVANGTACGDDAGTCQDASCEVACTEQGILDAVAAGGGPYTFDCVGPTTVTTGTPIVIERAVILDGEGKLRVDYTSHDALFKVVPGVGQTGTVELRDLTVGGPFAVDICAYGIENSGTVALTNVAVLGYCIGISNSGTVTMTNTTLSENDFGVGNEGTLTVTNSTMSRNSIGIDNRGMATLTNSTVSGNTASSGISNEGTLTLTNSLVDGDCGCRDPDDPNLCDPITSLGYNIESPGNTCGFDQEGDQAGVRAALLDLQPLAANGGPTQTHAITTESAAFNAGTCEVNTDQRGVDRPQGAACDVGAFELEQGGQ